MSTKEEVQYVFKSDTSGFKTGVDNSKSSVDKLDSSVRNAGAGLQKLGVGLTAISGIAFAVGKTFVDAANKQIQYETKLEEVATKRLKATEEEIQSMKDLAAVTQSLGVVGDEVIISGQAQVATFLNNAKSVETLTPAIANLLAATKGYNATTEDAQNIGNLFGKVMQGQIGALTRVGITFSEAQEKVLKFGTEEEKAAILAQVVADNFGDVNGALAKTPQGMMKQLQNEVGDLQEEIGKQLLPALLDIAKIFKDNVLPVIKGFVSFMEANPVFAKMAVGAVLLGLALGPVLTILGTIMSLFGLAGIAALAISAVLLAGINGVNFTDLFSKFGTELGNAVKNGLMWFNSLDWGSLTMGFITIVTDFVNGLWNGIVSFFSGFDWGASLAGLVNSILEIQSTAMSWLMSIDWGKVFTDTLLTLISISKGFVDNMISFLSNVDWGTLFQYVYNLFVGLPSLLINGIKSINWNEVLSALSDYILGIGGKLAKAAGDFLADVGSFLNPFDYTMNLNQGTGLQGIAPQVHQTFNVKTRDMDYSAMRRFQEVAVYNKGGLA